jgi:hypothetical protein
MRTPLFLIPLVLATAALAQESPPRLAWARRFADGPNVQVQDSATLTDGSCVVVGSFSGPTTFAPGDISETTIASQGEFDLPDAYVMLFGPAGHLSWLRTFGAGGADFAYGVSTFPDDTFVVTGQITGTVVFQAGLPDQTTIVTNGIHRMFVATYRSDGSLAWVRQDGGDSGLSVGAFPDGSCVVAGSLISTRTFGAGEPSETVLTLPYPGTPNLFVARYATGGDLAWARSAIVDDRGVLAWPRVGAFADGTCCVAGWHSGADAVFGDGEANETRIVFESAYGQGQQLFTARYGADGMLAWARSAGAEGRYVWPRALASAPDGSLRVVGATNGGIVFGGGEAGETTLPLDDLGFFARYQPDGALAWVRCAFSATPLAACVAPDGVLLTTGSTTYGVVFGPGEPTEATLPGSGTGWLAAHGPDGAFRWLVVIENSNGAVTGHGLAVAGSALLVSGRLNGSGTFGSGEIHETTLTASGAWAGFLARYEFNSPPVIEACNNTTITTQQQATTTLVCTVSDPDGDELTCHWLVDGVPVGASAPASTTCSLDLGTLAPLSIGDHTVTLKVSDGQATATAGIVVTVENSPPVAAPVCCGVYEDGPDSRIPLRGQAADFDGDTLTWVWRHDGVDLFPPATIDTPSGGAPVDLPLRELATSVLGVGVHEIVLVVDDGNTPAQEAPCTVEIKSGEGPCFTLDLSASILWPPSNGLVDVYVTATLCHPEPVTYAVEVTSNEALAPEDYEIVSIDHATGHIHLRLRAARLGKGGGRTYRVTVTATDAAGNVTTAEVDVVAPHDQGIGNG